MLDKILGQLASSAEGYEYADQRDHARKLADLYFKLSTSEEPIRHWSQGVARVLQALNARQYMGLASQGIQEQKRRDMSAVPVAKQSTIYPSGEVTTTPRDSGGTRVPAAADRDWETI